MGSYDIYISQRAKSDMRGIAAYIANELQEPDTALKIVDELLGGITSLQEMPERYAKVNDKRLAGKGIRKLKIGNYLIFFTIDSPQRMLFVIGVLYERRDWQNIL